MTLQVGYYFYLVENMLFSLECYNTRYFSLPLKKDPLFQGSIWYIINI